MDLNSSLRGPELEILLQRAKEQAASASLRAIGSPRLLGDLQVRGVEQGVAIQLMGMKRREQFPPAGTEIFLSILVGEEVVSSRSVLLEPIVFAEGDTMFPPVLRVAWPKEAIQTHRRQDVRVATPDLPPLEAVLVIDGRRMDVNLMNLTETGMGLGLAEPLSVAPRTQVEVETRLPGGELIRTPGEVRHAEVVEHESFPMRLGLVLGQLSDPVRDVLHRFIQARRMDRSEELRRTHGT